MEIAAGPREGTRNFPGVGAALRSRAGEPPGSPPAREMSACLSPREVWLVGSDGWSLEELPVSSPPPACPENHPRDSGPAPGEGGDESVEEPACVPAASPASQNLLEPPRSLEPLREPPAPSWGEAAPAPGGGDPWG